MKKIIALLIIAGAIGLLGFSGIGDVLFRTPDGWPAPAYDFKLHPLTKGKIALGRKLFYETALSRDSSISCSSCHLQYTAFTHIDHKLSHGIQGRMGARNAPALANLAWGNSFMWDGAIQRLDEMAQAPISAVNEMDASLPLVVARLQASREYRSLFYNAFDDSVITGGALMQALSQFMLTFVSASSKYDRVMAGTDTFTSREAHGYQVFRANCASCHTEPLFTNGEYENNGLEPDTALIDNGRMKITGKESDFMKFKVPSLRNVEVTYPYMHDGRYRNLQMVLFHYSEEIRPSQALSGKLKNKLSLPEQDKNDIVLFLKTLTDEAFLKNKNFEYPNAKL